MHFVEQVKDSTFRPLNHLVHEKPKQFENRYLHLSKSMIIHTKIQMKNEQNLPKFLMVATERRRKISDSICSSRQKHLKMTKFSISIEII